jgi:hypothetical protein
MTPDSDTIKFARFVFIFHWVIYASALIAVFVIGLHRDTTYASMAVLTLNAVSVLIASRRGNGMDIRDVAWHGFMIGWQDAVVTSVVLAITWFDIVYVLDSPWIYVWFFSAAAPSFMAEYIRKH